MYENLYINIIILYYYNVAAIQPQSGLHALIKLIIMIY